MAASISCECGQQLWLLADTRCHYCGLKHYAASSKSIGVDLSVSLLAESVKNAIAFEPSNQSVLFQLYPLFE